MKAFLWIIVGLVAAFFAFVIVGNVLYAQQHPTAAPVRHLSKQEQDRANIQGCRSLPHDQVSIAAGKGMPASSCEFLAIMYAKTYHEVP
jgi:hypothetical protein